MPLYLQIALRYLFGKKSTNAINIITGISVMGIAIGTAALILILSVFNGFEGMMKKYLNAFNADLKVLPVEGKFFELNNETLLDITLLENVDIISKTVEEVAIFEYNGTQAVGVLKGVDKYYKYITGFDSVIVSGQLQFKDEDINYCSVGIDLAAKMNISTEDRFHSLKVYMLKKNKKALENEFKSRLIYPSSTFAIRNDNDDQYVLSDLEFAQDIIEVRDQISTLEINLKSEIGEAKTKSEIEKILGSELRVLNRYEQDESFLRIMNIEKWSAFLILGFTLLLIIFNLIGSLWMIVMEKSKDISILQALGLRRQAIKNIFYIEGLLICLLGFGIGFFTAFLLYRVQLTYGIIGISNAFSKTPYPISMELSDVLAVLTLVTVLGLFASIPATRRASRITAYIRSE